MVVFRLPQAVTVYDGNGYFTITLFYVCICVEKTFCEECLSLYNILVPLYVH